MNRAGGDWRLKPGAAAIDAADPNDHPNADALGLLRNVGRPDAGPYEFGAKTPGGGAGPGPTPGAPSPGARRATRSKVRVLKVLNGRTLRVRGKHGKRFKVRLLGIRIPAARCGGRGATARLRALTGGKGKFVVLVRDPRARGARRQGPPPALRRAQAARHRADPRGQWPRADRRLEGPAQPSRQLQGRRAARQEP